MGKECKSCAIRPEYLFEDRTCIILIGMIIIVTGVLAFMICNGDLIGSIQSLAAKVMEK